MALGSHRSDTDESNPTSLGHRQSIESELVQRNREIAKVRDLLRQRELEITDWKARHSELVGRLSDVDGELTKTKARHKRDSIVGASPAPDIMAEALGLRAEVAARKQELDNMRAEHSKELEKLQLELHAERSHEKAALEAKEEALREVAETRREKNRSLEAASQKSAERDLEMAKQGAELAAARTEVARLTKELEDAHGETMEAHREKDSSCETASHRMAQHDLEITRLGAEVDIAKEEINQLRADLEKARSETIDALQRASEAQAGFETSRAQQLRDLHASWEVARIAKERAETLEERLATERHGIASQLSALEEQLSCERRARREAEEGRIASWEAAHIATDRAETLEERLATERHGIASQLGALEEQLSYERRARREAEEGRTVMSTDLKEALEGLNTTATKLKASEASSIIYSNEIERLRLEGGKLADRVVSLEEQLRSSSQFESRASALQTECSGLRSEVKLLRRQCQEMHEGFAMVAEESRTQKLEAAGENATLRLQLEETRRARSLEMHALVTKMCAVGAAGGTKEEY